MPRIADRRFALLLVVALLGAAIVLGGCGVPAAAQSTPPKRSLTVVGQGRASGKPDLAQASLGVETYAATVAEAMQQNSTKMEAVLAKLKELGIAEKDIQTANFSINLERQGPQDSGQYRVSNMVQVKIRDLTKVGAVLDAGVQAGVNQVWGVSFALEDQAALETEARAKAMEDARSRAEALAKLTSVQLGQVLTIQEGSSSWPIYGGAFGKGADAGPVSPGEVELSFQVQVSYAIQ